ncbi:hypothetical protein [Pseudomonas sp. NS1(2017)]|uniref:hypothetical protein n=1 Tax=Pseudomonas sp. NS1(2017) TaxID=2025658 RepID=UPI002115247F|nr:hypothetical protein [Pseudomonas sp. NS1(2017)]
MTISLQPPHASLFTLISSQTAVPANTPPAAAPLSNDNAHTPNAQPPASSITARSIDLKLLLADKHNLKILGEALGNIATRLGPDASPVAVMGALKNTPMAIHPDSADHATLGANATLDSFVTHLGLRLPSDFFSLTALSDAVLGRSQEHPLGNLAGALGWPVPMSAAEQSRMRAMVMDYSESPGKPQVESVKGFMLEFLRHRTSLSAEVLSDPVRTLNALISSPEGQLIGKALQDHMQGVATDSSSLDYLLAALLVQLDPESIATPRRNKVAGFDLANASHWGRHPSAVVDGLSQHLSTSGKTSPEMANAGAHLLLASRAPMFLIKDIPNSVTYGSPAWVNLTVAAATIEAQTPGRVPNMTFAQVMLEAEGVSLANPAVTEEAQRSALIDWGVANGVLEKKDDHQYSADELNTLVTTFKTRQSSMAQAAQAFEKDIPSRKEMALAELKKRFPGQESMFEKKVITALPHGAVTEFGPHSLLDVTMMYADANSTYTSTDPRTPVAQLNAHPGFGMYAAFESHFKDAIEEKKAAVSTSIKHLISQLPLQDRENFEYGKVSFYQTHTQKLGTGFFDKTPLLKDPKLLVRIERDGVPTAYEIDFNGGAIRKVPESHATTGTWRTANIEYEKKAFTPSKNANNLSTAQSVPNEPRLDSFASSRTQLIADAFVEHINLDDPAIHKQALGQTKADKIRQKGDVVGHFLLDLIPFVSTVKNFSQGKIGEGIVDLGLDIFGFLTAGVGTAGKLTKIAGSAVSTATKVARATKVIGAAVFGQLNPVDGVIGLLGGGGKLIGTGVSKIAEGVNKLRGAAGSYDLLKAVSLNNTAAATGSLKLGEHSIESAAVLKNGKWFAFDADKMRPYGSPLVGFTPEVVALEGEVRAFTDSWIGKMIGSVLAPAADNPEFRKDFIDAISRVKAEDNAAYIRGQNTGRPEAIYGYSTALNIDDLKRLAVAERRSPAELGSLVKRIDELEVLPERFNSAREIAKVADLDAYKKGYSGGNPENIAGFSPTLTLNELAELAIIRGRTPEEVGQLVKYMERRRVTVSQENFRVFSAEITAAGGKAIALPQGFYLSQASLLSAGECAALSNVMAAATQAGKQETFIKNLYASMDSPLSVNEINDLRKIDPVKATLEQRKADKINGFRNKLDKLQGLLGSNFHNGVQARQVPYTDILTELARANSSKTLLIRGPEHGITAGIIVTPYKVTVAGIETIKHRKEWFYFDPNFGKATFTTEQQMRSALESTLNSGRTKNLFKHYGDTPNVPEYKISVFDPADLNASTRASGIDVSDLYRAEI